MRCVCISCFDYYDIRMSSVINYFTNKGYKTSYIITDFQHFDKKRYSVDYKHTIQVHVPVYKKNVSFKRLVSHVVFAKNVRRILNRIKPDIIYCMIPPNSLVKEVAGYKKTHHVKVVYDCFDLWPESFPYKRESKLLKIPFCLWQNLRDEYLKSGDLMVCVSDETKKILEVKYDHMPTKVMLPLIKPAELPDYKFNIENVITFCYLGNINHITDIELGTSLLKQLAEHKKIIIHFIGEGQNKELFENQLRKSNVTVVNHGVVFDPAEKNKIFSECDFGLNIPREEIHSTMALKVVEYLKVGLPFLNSAEGNNFELVEDDNTGININRDNLSQTVDEILKVDSQKLHNMHKNCLNSYYNHFLNQNLDDILGTIIPVKNKNS